MPPSPGTTVTAALPSITRWASSTWKSACCTAGSRLTSRSISPTIRGRIAPERYGLAGPWMAEPKAFRVQGLAREGQKGRPRNIRQGFRRRGNPAQIDRIPDQRVAKLCQVDADLMRPPGRQPAGQQCGAGAKGT